jgi:DNA-binding GntR family transcriptional regulator
MLVQPTTANIICRNPSAIPRLIAAHTHMVDALRRRDREAALLWVDRHLRDWKAGFARSGLDLDSPVPPHITAEQEAAE